MSKILIIEDELPILDLIKMNLSLIGHEIHTASDGLEGFNMLQSSTYDLLLIDIMLPKMDGFEILDKINKKSMGIIILSAKFETIDKVRGLKLGADDYITKPFESMELLARVEALLRRCQKEDPITNNVIYKNLELNENERTVKLNDMSVELTIKEFELLLLLLKNQDIAFKRETLLDHIWGYSFSGGTRTIDMHISKLRQKLNLEDEIITVYKLGYKLKKIT